MPMNSPTLTVRATQLGVILGTAAYMAPEQARGKAVDKRADIWAFGVVLYEMLTGTRLFEGESVADTLGPDLRARARSARRCRPPRPPACARLIARCLVKDPRQRLRDIGDARLQIDDALAGRGEPSRTTAPAAAPVPRRRPWGVWLSVPVAAVAAATAVWFAKPVAPAPLVRLVDQPAARRAGDDRAGDLDAMARSSRTPPGARRRPRSCTCGRSATSRRAPWPAASARSIRSSRPTAGRSRFSRTASSGGRPWLAAARSTSPVPEDPLAAPGTPMAALSSRRNLPLAYGASRPMAARRSS